MGNPPSPPPIDLRTLPSQTDTAYWIIIVTLWGISISALIGSSPFGMWPAILCFWLIPFYHLLALPEKELKKKNIKKIETVEDQQTVSLLQKAINQLAHQQHFNRPIRLLISTNPKEARSFGTWYRHYIVLGEEIAQKLATDWQQEQHQPKAQALLLHEIGHFVNKDVQRIGYSRELLRSCFMVMGWWFIFGMVWISWSFTAMPAFLNYDWTELPTDPSINPLFLDWTEQITRLSPERRVELVTKIQTISLNLLLNFITAAFMPLSSTGLILWLFYWRRMMRLQEYYADHLAALVNPQALTYAFGRYVNWLQPDLPARSFFQRVQQIRQKIRPSFHLLLPNHWKSPISQLFDLHPTPRQRLNRLKNPFQQNWTGEAIAIFTLTLGIEILATNPLVTYHISAIPLFLATIGSFIFLSTWLLPFWVTQQPYKPLLIKIILFILGFRLALLIINISLILLGVLFFPQQLLEMLNLFIAAYAKFSSTSTDWQPFQTIQDALSLIPQMILAQLLLPIAVAFSLALYSWVQKPALAKSLAQVNWHRRHWQGVVAISTVTITLLLNPLSTLNSGDGTSLFSVGRLISYVIGLLAMGWLLFLHRQGKNGH